MQAKILDDGHGFSLAQKRCRDNNTTEEGSSVQQPPPVQQNFTLPSFPTKTATNILPPTTDMAQFSRPANDLPALQQLSATFPNDSGQLDRCAAESKNEHGGHGPRIAPFLVKVLEIVECGLYCDSICWSEDGATLVVKDIERLTQEVFPQYFNHSKWSSFLRQLHMYGFRKTKERTNGGSDNTISFKHPVLRRGIDDDTLARLRRRSQPFGNLKERRKRYRAVAQNAHVAVKQSANAVGWNHQNALWTSNHWNATNGGDAQSTRAGMASYPAVSQSQVPNGAIQNPTASLDNYYQEQLDSAIAVIQDLHARLDAERNDKAHLSAMLRQCFGTDATLRQKMRTSYGPDLVDRLTYSSAEVDALSLSNQPPTTQHTDTLPSSNRVGFFGFNPHEQQQTPVVIQGTYQYHRSVDHTEDTSSPSSYPRYGSGYNGNHSQDIEEVNSLSEEEDSNDNYD